MPAQSDLARLVCRPALPMDTPEVLAFTRQIWEGEDYVPHVWEDWLADSEGLLAVAEYGGKIVGLSKLTRLDRDQWWLEGLRVHPEYQGRGVAAHLHDFLLNYWSRHAGGVVRLATVSSREPVKHLAARTGFHQVAEFTHFVAPALNGGKTKLRIFTEVDRASLKTVLSTILTSSLLMFSFGLINLGWQWARPSSENLARYYEQHPLWWWRRKRNVVIAAVETEEEPEHLSILFIACPETDLVECLRDIRLLAGEKNCHHVRWLAPVNQKVFTALTNAGFERDRDESIVIFEKNHQRDE